MFCVFFPIGLIGLIGLIAPIGLIALGFLRERLIALRGSRRFAALHPRLIKGRRFAAFFPPDGEGAVGTDLALFGA